MSIEEEAVIGYVEQPPPIAGEADHQPVADHLIRLPGGEWSLWRCVGLRGAGFPASEVERLSSQACAEAAEGLLSARAEQEAARQEAMRLVRCRLDAVRAEGGEQESIERSRLNKVLRQVKKGKHDQQEVIEGLEEAMGRMRRASEGVKEAEQGYEKAYEGARSKVSEEIVKVASWGRFREAVLWQNRNAVTGSIDALLSMDHENATRGKERRKREAVVASYLQRYSVKNDTIGFFGPVGWACFREDVASFRSRPGPRLLRRRGVYFEGWAIDKLAQRLAQDRPMLQWAVPRLLPFARVEGRSVATPFRAPMQLSGGEAAALSLCDGHRTANEIALRLIGEGAGFSTNEEVYGVLEGFRVRKLIEWTLEVPLVVNPDRRLRQMMQRVGDPRLRDRALAMLDELEEARLGVASAAGDCDRLDQALEELERTFTRLTGSAATKQGVEGKAYAARTLVYEDCQRDIELSLGREFIGRLGGPLSLILTSARWLASAGAASYRGLFDKVYEGLAGRAGGGRRVEAVSFWYSVVPLLFEGKLSPVEAVMPEFQRKWAEVLGDVDEASKEVSYRSEELKAAVGRAFAVGREDEVRARYHSPDVMVAAKDEEAIRRGEYELVLGEIHVGVNTLQGALFAEQHPRPEELRRCFDIDLPESRVVLVGPKSTPGLTVRTLPTMVTGRDWLLMGTQDSFGAPKSQALNIGSLVIERVEGQLIASTRDGALKFDIMQAFGDALSASALNHFKMLKPQKHTPRVSIDRLVVSRETWTIVAEEADFAFEPTEPGRFVAARRWKRSHGMPRHVFYKSPVEPKPCYVDFDSPIYVEMFARAIRRTKEGGGASEIRVTEMLPGPGQNWLTDMEGNAYTSELRLIAVDPVGQQRHAWKSIG